MKFVKNILWKHGLITVFLFVNIIPIFTSIFIKNDNIQHSNLNLDWAIFYISFALIFVLLGYFSYNKRSMKYKNYTYTIKNSYVYLLITMCLFGTFMAYKIITTHEGIADIANVVMSGESVSAVRNTAVKTSGGGILKMFITMPICFFLALSSLMIFYPNRINYQKANIGMCISLIFLIIKVFLLFDRASLGVMFCVLLYNLLFNYKVKKIYTYVAIFLTFVFVSYITAIRMPYSNKMDDFLSLYFSSGVVNLELLIDKQQFFNYDFSQTLLAPLAFIFRFIDIPFNVYPLVDHDIFIAQSFWGYHYLDFKFIGIFLMFFYGYVIGYIERNKFSNLYCASIYFVIMFCIITFPVVPIIRTIEFWLMLITIYMFNKLLVKPISPAVKR